MTTKEFSDAIDRKQIPQGNALLKALWYDAQGDWESAHELVQNDTTTHGAWLHAYLHRKEGDISNAKYWYHRADRSFPSASLEEEFKILTTAFLNL
jgi:hypothetical protein